MQIPTIGLGTSHLTGRECTKVVKLALKIGYRHIDTAHVYENHRAIKKAIGEFDRTQLFITSKLAPEQVDPKNVQKSVEKACTLALKELGTSYLDLYLIHKPNRSLSLSAIYRAMENLVHEGKIKQTGVSNFTIHHLEDLIREGCHPQANQVEFHPYLYQKDLLNFCRSQKIELISYRSFGKGKILGDPILEQIGQKHGKHVAQVILRWLVQKGIPSIPKASSESHLRENLNVFDFSLTDHEIEKIEQLHRNQRFCMVDFTEFNY